MEEKKEVVLSTTKEENIETNPKEKESSFGFSFFSSNWYLFVFLFISVFIVLLTGYLLSPVQKNCSVGLFVLDIISFILCTGVAIFLIVVIRNKLKKEGHSKSNILFASIFAILFLAGFILTITFRLIALYQPNSFVNIGGLLSLFVSVAGILLILAAALIPFRRFE